MDSSAIETISIPRMRREALISQLNLYELGLAAMDLNEIRTAQAARLAVAATALQTAQ